LGSNDEEWDDSKEEAQAEMAKATSKTAQIMQLILDGLYQNPTIGSSESSQEEGRIPTIFLQTSTYMCDILESTHNKNNGQTEVVSN
jgi:hypothetical protein